MMQNAAIIPLLKDVARQEHQLQLTCESCALYSLCLPLGLHRNDLETLDSIIKRSKPLTRGQALYEMSENFDSLYVVRSGAFKTTLSTEDGREQITGFYLPGDLIGMDAIHTGSYQATAKALSSSSVCALPYSSLQELSQAIPALQQQIYNRLSKELSNDKHLLMALGQKTAMEKLVGFLLSLSRRFEERGYAANTFELPMSRIDIANHLGLAIETISRLLGQLVNDDLIACQGKSITLIDKPALKKLCN
ncbi:fumarate/nitrate reduction transcriptional regulator Fnr [Methylophaga sp. OBS3]|uniref:fumarate/nitrate reduction transcriptional regulator Fnr n=1 Tax=Methylophaga sp. OBS3 TaxID=2991934 RepID=UPI0022564D52|nr:fumarate/nitrate reduction transcriptional regulator Fnr [Methylophaga sp. OBS3]